MPEGMVRGKIVELNEEVIKAHLNTVVWSTVEEPLKVLLDAEADRLCKARREERKVKRADTRAGSCRPVLQTKAGEVSLKVSKLRTLPFETAIIERSKLSATSGGRAAWKRP
jgi:transposase-like protein